VFLLTIKIFFHPCNDLDFEASRRFELKGFSENRYKKVVRLLALSTGRLYPQGKVPGTHFGSRLEGLIH
jgi:hypothetical protein